MTEKSIMKDEDVHRNVERESLCSKWFKKAKVQNALEGVA